MLFFLKLMVTVYELNNNIIISWIYSFNFIMHLIFALKYYNFDRFSNMFYCLLCYSIFAGIVTCFSSHSFYWDFIIKFVLSENDIVLCDCICITVLISYLCVIFFCIWIFVFDSFIFVIIYISCLPVLL